MTAGPVVVSAHPNSAATSAPKSDFGVTPSSRHLALQHVGRQRRREPRVAGRRHQRTPGQLCPLRSQRRPGVVVVRVTADEDLGSGSLYASSATARSVTPPRRSRWHRWPEGRIRPTQQIGYASRRGRLLAKLFRHYVLDSCMRRSREAVGKCGRVYVSFSPAVSREALKAMRHTVRGWRLRLKYEKNFKNRERPKRSLQTDAECARGVM